MGLMELLRGYLEIGFMASFALVFLVGIIWMFAKLGPLLIEFFKRYIALADVFTEHLEATKTIAQDMLALHKEPSSPCNTIPLRHAGIAAADVLDEIGDKVGADVAKSTQKIRDALATNWAGG